MLKRNSILSLFLIPSLFAAERFTPTDKYQDRNVQGFVVKLHPEVLKHTKELDAALAELESQLKQIKKVLSRKQLQELEKVRFWLEWKSRPKGAAEVHVSKDWLRDNGYNPDKWLDVEIGNLVNFVKWSQTEQPWMVMHELAHAYHFRTLGEDYEGIHSAFKNAKDRKLYDSVKRVNGRIEKAYAMTNANEYFAELTEAYLGKNDFYPFTREELNKHDPVGFALMEKIWGEKQSKE